MNRPGTMTSTEEDPEGGERATAGGGGIRVGDEWPCHREVDFDYGGLGCFIV